MSNLELYKQLVQISKKTHTKVLKNVYFSTLFFDSTMDCGKKVQLKLYFRYASYEEKFVFDRFVFDFADYNGTLNTGYHIASFDKKDNIWREDTDGFSYIAHEIAEKYYKNIVFQTDFIDDNSKSRVQSLEI